MSPCQRARRRNTKKKRYGEKHDCAIINLLYESRDVAAQLRAAILLGRALCRRFAPFKLYRRNIPGTIIRSLRARAKERKRNRFSLLRIYAPRDRSRAKSRGIETLPIDACYSRVRTTRYTSCTNGVSFKMPVKEDPTEFPFHASSRATKAIRRGMYHPPCPRWKILGWHRRRVYRKFAIASSPVERGIFLARVSKFPRVSSSRSRFNHLRAAC